MTTETLPFAFAVLFALVAVLAIGFALAQIARASVAGHVPGAGSHAGGGSAGNGKSTTDSVDDDRTAQRLRMKRELLEQWAKDGKTIDVVTEARAELLVLEIEDAGSQWRDYTASAADEPITSERPFAS